MLVDEVEVVVCFDVVDVWVVYYCVEGVVGVYVCVLDVEDLEVEDVLVY